MGECTYFWSRHERWMRGTWKQFLSCLLSQPYWFAWMGLPLSVRFDLFMASTRKGFEGRSGHSCSSTKLAKRIKKEEKKGWEHSYLHSRKQLQSLTDLRTFSYLPFPRYWKTETSFFKSIAGPDIFFRDPLMSSSQALLVGGRTGRAKW